MQRTCLVKFCNNVCTSNDKTKTNLNASLIFGLFTIDGDKKVHDGHGHHHVVYNHTSPVEIVSIKF